MPVITYLEALNNYFEVYSVYIDDGAGSTQITDIHFSLDNNAILFILEGIVTSKILHFGTIDNNSALVNGVPTIKLFEFVAESSRSFDITSGDNFGAIEDLGTVYIAIRGPEMTVGSEINYFKTDLSGATPTL